MKGFLERFLVLVLEDFFSVKNNNFNYYKSVISNWQNMRKSKEEMRRGRRAICIPSELSHIKLTISEYLLRSYVWENTCLSEILPQNGSSPLLAYSPKSKQLAKCKWTWLLSCHFDNTVPQQADWSDYWEYPEFLSSSFHESYFAKSLDTKICQSI